ncbi:MAG: DinB family protein [Dehalococcoidia bacterium]|nr:DinB family protein [Dehalococcoidia bacterium]
MPVNAPLAAMFEYARWATLAVFDATAAHPEVLGQPIPNTDRTLRDLLRHVASSQDVFVARLRGEDQFAVMARWREWPGMEAARAAAAASGDALAAIAGETDPAADVFIAQGFDYPPGSGQRSEISHAFLLTHAFSHGCLHREQACAALSAAGIEAPDLDGWGYAAVADVVRLLPP